MWLKTLSRQQTVRLSKHLGVPSIYRIHWSFNCGQTPQKAWLFTKPILENEVQLLEKKNAKDRIAISLAQILGYFDRKPQILRFSRFLYEKCQGQLERQKSFFVTDCGMPDNFQTWFSVTQWYLWMTLVRLRAEGAEGKELSQSIVDLFFADLEPKMFQSGVKSGRKRSEHVKELLQTYYGGMVAYDQGLATNDPILMASLWRNLFKTEGTPQQLCSVLYFTRLQLEALESVSRENLYLGKFEYPTLELLQSPTTKNQEH